MQQQTLTIDVTGTPAPQGSKRGIPIRRKNGTIGAAIVESAGDKLTTWRQDVRAAAEKAAQEHHWTTPPRDIALIVDIHFAFTRPKSHYRTGKNSHLLRDNAPKFHTTKPDIDKLIRGILDALTSAGIYTDDSNVIRAIAVKSYANQGESPGASIYVTALIPNNPATNLERTTT